ncbi:MAG: iron-sulfur cluster assembly scaffold protein, partial [Nanoarchaeota archaeon]|nr:iron-sulfur cluster assembly scaffold protein [Nanoarchaeota archaeon]
MYSKKVIKHFQNPKFAGEMKSPDAVGEFGNVRCGDSMKIFLKVRKGIIVDVKFLTYGCVAAIACSDMLCELVKGKKVEDALKVTHKDIIKSLGEMPPVKHHCSVLGIQALRKAIEEY